MQTGLADYIDISPIIIEERVVDLIRKAKVEIK